MKIETKDATGKPNGFVVPGWNVLEQPGVQPAQVYLTIVAPHSVKGPHLHKVRRQMLWCVHGNIRVICRMIGFKGHEPVPFYTEHFSGEDHDYRIVMVLPGVPQAIYNEGDSEALVINMPAPAWSAEAPDEWPVENWNYGISVKPIED